MNIENELYPESGQLIKKDETATAGIVDAELDLLECHFNNDLCVEIDTSGFSHITLSLENLDLLKELIIEAEEYYKEVL